MKLFVSYSYGGESASSKVNTGHGCTVYDVDRMPSSMDDVLAITNRIETSFEGDQVGAKAVVLFYRRMDGNEDDLTRDEQPTE